MALHLVFRDKQQIISKSQQPCAVRFLQEPTSISLQPARLPVLSSPLFSSDCSALRQTMARLSRNMCMHVSDLLRLFALSLSCRNRANVRGCIRLSHSHVRDKETLLALNKGIKGAPPANGNWMGLSCYIHIYMTGAVACFI